MKERVAEMEREAKMLRDMQAQADTNTNSTAGSDEAVPMETDEDKGAADARSVHVGNVRPSFSSKMNSRAYHYSRWTMRLHLKKFNHILTRVES